ADLLGALEAHADDLGLSRGQILLRSKAVLVVEGAQDVAVLRRYYDRHLRERRVLVLPLHGLNEALSLLELEFLARLDVPLVLLCDNAREELLRRGRLPGTPTAEEQKVFLLLLSLRGAARLHVVSHGLPDIVAALPEAAVGAALRAAGGGTFPGWARLAEGARRRKISLKDHFAQRLGVTVDGAFVDSVLRAADPAAPAPELDRAMQEALAVAGVPIVAGGVLGWRQGAVACTAAYLEALQRAGGDPVIVPPVPLDEAEAGARLGRFDGVLLVGGGDLDPGLYGQEARPEVAHVNPVRDKFEIPLVRAAIARGL